MAVEANRYAGLVDEAIDKYYILCEDLSLIHI